MANKKIPLLVEPRVVATSIGSIPLLIHQTYLSNEVPSRMYDSASSWIDKNPEFEYRFYDDEGCLQLINNHFDGRTAAAYRALPKGAFRADFWRYCCLYVYGGVYADIDTACLLPLTKLISKKDRFVVPYGRVNHSFLFNAFLCAEPKHPLLKTMIDNATDTIESNYGNCDEYTFGRFNAMYAADLGSLNTASKEAILAAFSFGLVGPMGLGNMANQLLGRAKGSPFSVGRIKIMESSLRVLRFSSRFGIRHGIKKVLEYKYDGYEDDLQESGGNKWF